MPNTETVRALIDAFNVNNYDFNAVKTNFKLQSEGKKDYIVVSFEKSMDTYQCRGYLDSIKRKIIREFYGIEESNDAEILDTAKLIFDVNSFPFYISDRDWSWDKQHGFKFVTPVDKGVIFNLKSHLAASLAKDVIEGMPTCNIRASDRKGYLWRGEFDNKGLRKQFESEFLSRMENRYVYRNVFKNPLKVEGNSVYIKDVFNDARFIDSVTRRAAWRIGIDLGVGNDVDHSVMLLKDSIINSVYQSTKIIVVGFICASPLNREEASILIPLVLGGEGKRILTSEEALKLNYAFDGAVFYNLYDRTQGELSINKSDGMYSIDFSNPEISHCVITKIIGSSVINKDHELSIDPERALSPVQSPFNSPMHAGPSGIRTPPNQRKKDTDSGYDSNSPPKPKDSGAHSPSGGPRSSVEQVQTQRLPTRSQDGVLKDSPRRESEKFPVLLPVNQLDVPGTSREFPPSPQLSSSGPSSSKGAQAGANISKEEEKLIEALLYWFNLNNYALDPPHTNFIVKNGKIASLIDDSVNVREYLREVIDKTKEEYRVNKEEAYDLNEFPFQFLSNCEKNQETTVANISRGALLNLKKLFSREHEGKVEIKDIDINIVEKAVKSEKNKWVNFQVQEHGLLPQKAIETCYPDESALEYISITKDKGGYWINRNYDASEVRSFRKEQWPAKGTRNTTTTFKKIEESKKDDSSSGYSSGFVTDAENVSSKAEATTSGCESMDCENTGGGSPKRTLELSVGIEELTISTDLYATKAEQHSPIKKFRSN